MNSNFAKKRPINLIFVGGLIAAAISLTPMKVAGSISFAAQSTAQGDISATVVSGGVELEWHVDEPGGTLSVRRDDTKILAADSDGVFFDEFNFDGMPAVYEVVWIRSATDTDSIELPSDSAVRDLDASQFDLIEIRTLTVAEGVFEPLGVAPAVAATLPNSTAIRYQTFIREKWVTAPSPACSIDLIPYPPADFAGDNRGFSATSSAYRTRFTASINWLNAGSMAFSKSVGATSRYRLNYDGTHTLEKTATASTSGMTATTISESATNVKFKFSHNVKNPLCNSDLTSGIYYSYTFSVWRSGAYSVSGVALRVPNHELYLKNPEDAAWTPIFRRTGSDFSCLVPLNSGANWCLNSEPYSGLF